MKCRKYSFGSLLGHGRSLQPIAFSLRQRTTANRLTHRAHASIASSLVILLALGSPPLFTSTMSSRGLPKCGVSVSGFAPAPNGSAPIAWVKNPFVWDWDCALGWFAIPFGNGEVEGLYEVALRLDIWNRRLMFVTSPLVSSCRVGVALKIADLKSTWSIVLWCMNVVVADGPAGTAKPLARGYSPEPESLYPETDR